MFRLPVKGAAVHAVALAELSCPHLGDKGCEVYAERPLICR
jgi:Fe-S-cluster containining protein